MKVIQVNRPDYLIDKFDILFNYGVFINCLSSSTENIYCLKKYKSKGEWQTCQNGVSIFQGQMQEVHSFVDGMITGIKLKDESSSG